jgi:hypothetical protein
MKINKPPQPIVKDFVSGKKIFLAGSIEMGNAEDWQSEVTNYLKVYEESLLQELTIFNPRRIDWDSSWTQEISNPQFYQQVNWELNALEKSDIIIMYFDPNTKSPISLLELGLFAQSKKLIVCCPKGFWRKGNVDIVCDRYNIPNYDSLEKLLNYLTNIL